MKKSNKKEFPDQKVVKNYKKAKEKNTITRETTWQRRKKLISEMAWWIPK